MTENPLPRLTSETIGAIAAKGRCGFCGLPHSVIFLRGPHCSSCSAEATDALLDAQRDDDWEMVGPLVEAARRVSAAWESDDLSPENAATIMRLMAELKIALARFREGT